VLHITLDGGCVCRRAAGESYLFAQPWLGLDWNREQDSVADSKLKGGISHLLELAYSPNRRKSAANLSNVLPVNLHCL
jgi:hypothetical protein